MTNHHVTFLHTPPTNGSFDKAPAMCCNDFDVDSSTPIDGGLRLTLHMAASAEGDKPKEAETNESDTTEAKAEASPRFEIVSEELHWDREPVVRSNALPRCVATEPIGGGSPVAGDPRSLDLETLLALIAEEQFTRGAVQESEDAAEAALAEEEDEAIGNEASLARMTTTPPGAREGPTRNRLKPPSPTVSSQNDRATQPCNR